jgi:hypothetical protein
MTRNDECIAKNERKTLTINDYMDQATTCEVCGNRVAIKVLGSIDDLKLKGIVPAHESGTSN